MLPEPGACAGDGEGGNAGDESTIYSCFHCDRMENLHSLLAGEKRVVLVPPGQKDVLKSTRFSMQSQWLITPVIPPSGGTPYLRHTSITSQSQLECTSDQSSVQPLSGAPTCRMESAGMWPDNVDVPVFDGRLRKGDTLYIPAYHWHFVATSTPPALNKDEDGPLAVSVNYWWWPVHGESEMERWSYQNELQSWDNKRIQMPETKAPSSRESHALSFYRLTATKLAAAMRRRGVPEKPPVERQPSRTVSLAPENGSCSKATSGTDAEGACVHFVAVD